MPSTRVQAFQPKSISTESSRNNSLRTIDLFVGKYVMVQSHGNDIQYGILTGVSRDKKTGTTFLILEQIPGGSKVVRIEDSQKVQIKTVTSGDDSKLNSLPSRKALEGLSRVNIEPVRIAPRNNSADITSQLLRFIGHEVEVLDNSGTDCVVERGWLNSKDDITDKPGNGVTLTLSRLLKPGGEKQLSVDERMVHSSNHHPRGITVRLAV